MVAGEGVPGVFEEISMKILKFLPTQVVYGRFLGAQQVSFLNHLKSSTLD